MDRVVRVADRVRIQDVYLESSRTRRGDDAAFSRSGMRLEYSQRPPQLIQADASDEFALKVSLLVVAKPDEPEADAALEVEATFVLQYSLSRAEGVTSEDLTAFGLINGVYNAWPYWREFVQNTTARMGLPTITAPVFRLSDALSDQSTAEDQPAIGSTESNDEEM